jgi:hypothetical protein
MSSFPPLGWAAGLLRGKMTPAVAFADVVLEERLLRRLAAIVTATANTTQRNAPFRNLCLYGVPGTGETPMTR